MNQSVKTGLFFGGGLKETGAKRKCWGLAVCEILLHSFRSYAEMFRVKNMTKWIEKTRQNYRL